MCVKNAGKEFGSRKHNFSFVQFWAARKRSTILGECVALFLGNQPTKHKRDLEIIG